MGASAPWVTKGVPKKKEEKVKERERKSTSRGTPRRGSREENFRGTKLRGGVRVPFFNFAPRRQN